MKQILFSIVLTIFASSIQAGGFSFFKHGIKGSGDLETETRDLDSFEKIKVKGAFDVYVTVGEKQSVTLTFDDNLLEVIETEVNGRTLLLDSKESYSSRKNCKIEITIPKLEYVKLYGSGDIEVKNLNQDMFEYELAGSGDLTAEGHVNELEILLSGSGDIDTRELKADNVYAKLSGSGDIKVHASKSFDGRVSGSGDIVYYGKPDIIDKKVSGSGSIRGR